MLKKCFLLGNLLIASSCFAGKDKIYVGAGFSNVSYVEASDFSSSLTPNLFLGYKINDNFSLEVSHNLNKEKNLGRIYFYETGNFPGTENVIAGDPDDGIVKYYVEDYRISHSSTDFIIKARKHLSRGFSIFTSLGASHIKVSLNSRDAHNDGGDGFFVESNEYTVNAHFSKLAPIFGLGLEKSINDHLSLRLGFTTSFESITAKNKNSDPDLVEELKEITLNKVPYSFSLGLSYNL